MDFEITKREIIASISMLAIMLIIGIFVGGKVDSYYQDQQAKYYKAFKIDKDKDLFTYAMKTNVGNAFVEGQLKAVDTVSHKDIKGNYLVLEQVKEEYTMHTRTVTTKDSKGKTHTKTETYWTWDRVGSETFKANEVTFLGVKFKSSQFDLPETSYIDTVSGGYHVRYKYYGLEPSFNATIFANLRDNNIQGDKIQVNMNETIQEVLDSYTYSIHNVIFWSIWSVIIFLVIYLFVYLENDWLNK